MSRDVIELPDGYQGAKCKFFADPLETEGPLVKLQCAEEGKGHLIRWARITEVEALKEQPQ